MTARHEQQTESWIRFGEYAIDGGMIKPVPGAVPDAYDPWAGYRAATRGTTIQPHHRDSQRGQAPYLRLVRLGEILEPAYDAIGSLGFPNNMPISRQQSSAILDFVRTHGLLGIFHHSVMKVGQSRLGRVWVQHGGQWVADQYGFHEDPFMCLAINVVGFTTPEPFPFEKLAERFFVGELPEPLPHPTSVEFLQYYGERIFDFVVAAVHFLYAVRDALQGDTHALDTLRVGIFNKTKVIRNGRGNIVRCEDEVVFPSLLHAFAEQVDRDLKGGFRLMICSGCAALVRTNYHRTRYCSEQCRWKVVRRAQRARATRRKRSSTKRGAK